MLIGVCVRLYNRTFSEEGVVDFEGGGLLLCVFG